MIIVLHFTCFFIKNPCNGFTIFKNIVCTQQTACVEASSWRVEGFQMKAQLKYAMPIRGGLYVTPCGMQTTQGLCATN